MNAGVFLPCINSFGLATGLTSGLEAIYTFNSGYTSSTTGIIYNQLYSTGYHFFNNYIYGPSEPLINLSTPLNNNQFSGTNFLKVGYQHTGNFGIILDVQYSGCSKLNGKDYVLFSTVDNVNNLNSGFILSINDSNRLTFQTSGYNYTAPHEFTTHDFVYASLSLNQFVNFGIYSVLYNTYYGVDVVAPTNNLNSDNIYIGGCPILTGTYTGFFGQINQAILFSNGISAANLNSCINCSFATGFIYSGTSLNFSGFIITGGYYSGIESFYTSYVNVTGYINTQSNNLISIIIPSGITGQIITGNILIPLTSGVAISLIESGYSFLYNYAGLSQFAQYTIEFDPPLMSGDVLEINTYQTYNPNIGQIIDQMFDYPTGNGTVQLYANGLCETSGIDYFIDFEHNQISGYFSTDNISYDLISGIPIVLPYSGYWQNSRILMSGGGYFPPTPQFFESTVSYPGQVLITGMSGVSINNPFIPNFGYDIYINGQRLVSGIQYNIVNSGTNGFVVYLSGANLPYFLSTELYASTGGPPTGITNLDVPELSFIPTFNNFIRNEINPTGVLSGLLVTGFSPQVWINGLRMVLKDDYYIVFPCSCSQNFIDIPYFTNTIYSTENDSIGLWNFPI